MRGPGVTDQIGDLGAGEAADEGNARHRVTTSAESTPDIAASGTYSAYLAARLDGLEATLRGRRGESRAPQHAGGPRPGVVWLAPETKLRYRAGARKRGKSAGRLALYCGAGAVGEFFDRHPGPQGVARADLTRDMKKQLCETVPPLGLCDFQRAELDRTRRVHGTDAGLAGGPGRTTRHTRWRRARRGSARRT